jgi:hypothetical protein
LAPTKATPLQIRLADQRGDAAYKKFSTSQKQALKESGYHGIPAVRTSDPTPAQNAEIRSNLKTGKIFQPSQIRLNGENLLCDDLGHPIARSSARIATRCLARKSGTLRISIPTQPSTWAIFSSIRE